MTIALETNKKTSNKFDATKVGVDFSYVDFRNCRNTITFMDWV